MFSPPYIWIQTASISPKNSLDKKKKKKTHEVANIRKLIQSQKTTKTQ